MKAIILSVAFLLVSAVAASAFECPLLQAQIDKEYGNRLDAKAASVKSMAAQAWALHQGGKHADSVKMYDEAAKAGGMKLMHKKK